LCAEVVFADLGARYVYSHLRRDYSIIYTAKPPLRVTELFDSNVEVREAVVQFYETVQFKYEDLTLWQLFWNLLDIFDGEFYLRQSVDYWKLDLKYPFIGLDWWDAPVPGHTAFTTARVAPLRSDCKR
jgi:hypothetical protein